MAERFSRTRGRWPAGRTISQAPSRSGCGRPRAAVRWVVGGGPRRPAARTSTRRADFLEIEYAFRTPAPRIGRHLGPEMLVQSEPDPVELLRLVPRRQLLHRLPDLGQMVAERLGDVGLHRLGGRGLAAPSASTTPSSSWVSRIVLPSSRAVLSAGRGAASARSFAWSFSSAMPSRRALARAAVPATALARLSAVSGGCPRRSATTAAQSVRTGARLTLIDGAFVMGGTIASGPASAARSGAAPFARQREMCRLRPFSDLRAPPTKVQLQLRSGRMRLNARSMSSSTPARGARPDHVQQRTPAQRPRESTARAGGGHAGTTDAAPPPKPDGVSTACSRAPLKFCPDHSKGAGQPDGPQGTAGR